MKRRLFIYLACLQIGISKELLADDSKFTNIYRICYLANEKDPSIEQDNLYVSANSHSREVKIDTFYIEVWNGIHHQVGRLGEVQNDFNVLGHVYSKFPLASLTYSVNGGAPQILNTTIFRRIVRENDFNADIPVSTIREGENIVVLKALDVYHDSVEARVFITRKLNGVYPFPVNIHWAEVKDIEDVGEATDGKWSVGSKGIRTLEVGYDRVVLFGNRSWRDYEVTCKVTINGLSNNNGPQSWIVKHVGFCFRWSGHSMEDNQPGDQPKWGLHPRGALVGLTIINGKFPPVRQFYPGDSEDFKTFSPFVITLGKAFWMKGKCQTLPDSAGAGVTKYCFKVWNQETKEPAGWDFEVVQKSESALRSGGLALVAHELDVTFGDFFFKSLESPSYKEK